MANTPVAPERRVRAIMHLLSPYNWSLRQVADDIGASISTVHQWCKHLEWEGLIAQEHDLTGARSPEQLFTIRLETAALSEHAQAEYCRGNGPYVEQVKQWKRNCRCANSARQLSPCTRRPTLPDH